MRKLIQLTRILAMVLLLSSTICITYAQSPQITSINPVSGPIGTLVKIKGSNIDNTTALTVGGTNALIISNDGNTLVGMVMPGTTTGAISLTTTAGNVTLADYSVTAPGLPIAQRGNKLVPNNIIGAATVGLSTALSDDGNTALIGGMRDDGNNGAAWIYTKLNGVWIEQIKLTNPGTANSFFGGSVALSADGNTAIVGARGDDNGIGAAYIYVRAATTWTFETKLIGTGYSNQGGDGVGQGSGVSLSADGKVALIGGYFDDSDVPTTGYGYGAAWIFRKNGNTWTQDGPKLKDPSTFGLGGYLTLSADGTTALILDGQYGFVYVYKNGTWSLEDKALTLPGAAAYIGSLSANGNIALVGGWGGANPNITGYLFTRSAGVWSNSAILTTDNNPVIPYSGVTGNVDLSADGNLALIGGGANTSLNDDSWLYQKQGQTWNLISKLRGTNAIGFAFQGTDVQLSSDGQTAIVGGGSDNANKGAFWVYNTINTPTNPSTTQVTYNSFTANWDYVATNNGNFQLLVSETSDFSSSVKYEFASSIKSFTVKGLSPTTTYYWKVQAINYLTNPIRESGFSSTAASITTSNPFPDKMQIWGRSAGYDVAVFKINADGTDYKNIYTPDATTIEVKGLGNMLQANDGYVYFAYATNDLDASNQATLTGGKGGIYKSRPDGTTTSLLYAMDPSIGYPNRMLMEASDGHFYGRFEKGESLTDNTSGIYRLTKNGNFQVIYNFQNNQLPSSMENLVENTDGFLYGVSTRVDFPQTGNRSSFIFKIAKDGSGYSVVYDFPVSPSDLALSTGTLVADKSGALYGKFYFADSGQEKIIKLLNGNLTSIKTFPTSSRSYDAQTLTIGSDGYLYGGILNDNWQNNGLFKISTDGSNYSSLYTFTFDDGFYPFTPLVEHNGKLYGTLWQGPTNFDSEIFSINLNGTGFTKLYDFLVTSSAISPSPISLINPDALGVVKQDQTITFAPLSTIPVGTAPVMLSATASSGLPVTYVSSNTAVATVNGNMLNVLSAGSTDITASQVGDANYNAATDVKRTLVVNAAPCGVIYTPTITANLADTEIPVLTSSADTGNQWFLNGELINGAIQNTHIATQPGMYTVQVTQGNCISTLSNPYSIVITGIEKQIHTHLYPNPAETKLTFTSPTTDALSVQIIDLMGRTVKQLNYSNGGENRMDVSEIAAGSYIFKASQNGQVKTIHFYKK